MHSFSVTATRLCRVELKRQRTTIYIYIYILDDLIKLLKEVKIKMYDPTRAKYEYTTLTELLHCIFETKQEDNESQTDYTKRFKQNRDIVRDLVGTNILSNFVEKTAK